MSEKVEIEPEVARLELGLGNVAYKDETGTTTDDVIFAGTRSSDVIDDVISQQSAN